MRIESLDITHKVGVLSLTIKWDPDQQTPDVIVPVMNGAMVFASDLVRMLYPEVDPIIFPIKLNRYQMASRAGEYEVVCETDMMDLPLGGWAGKRVLLIDTIYDTGATIEKLKLIMRERYVYNVKSCCLFWRNNPALTTRPDIYGFDLKGDPSFLTGYGLDNDKGRGRGMPWVESIAPK